MAADLESDRPPMGVYVVNLWVEIGGTRVATAGAYCEQQAEAKQLAQEMAGQAQRLAGDPQARKFLQLIGVSGMGANVRFVPRHSPLALPQTNGQLIVGKG